MKQRWIPGMFGFVILAVMLGLIGVQKQGEVCAASVEGNTHAPRATLVVTSTANSGYGTLRWALQTTVTSDTITFDPAVFPLVSPVSITLTSGLPDIITDGVTIDGSSAGVILDGSGTPTGTAGLVIDGANQVVIKGLQVLYFPGDGVRMQGGTTNSTIGGVNSGGSCTGECNLVSGNSGEGVLITDSGTTSNTVSGNYVGTNLSGTTIISNAGVGGVSIRNGASHNLVGGINTSPGTACSGACNLISGNGTPGAGGGAGVWLQDNGTTNNTVSGNLVGTNFEGKVSLGNSFVGVSLAGGAQYNIIGGDTDGERNVISGNGSDGVWISDSGADRNTVVGNYIGTNIDATDAIPNNGSGVHIRNSARFNRIGSDTASERNLISGNGVGVLIDDNGTMSNTVSGNYIGTDVSGTVPLPNNGDGILIINGASENLIGGDNAILNGLCSGDCNLVSGNDGNAVSIGVTGTMSNIVSGNYIGTNVSGTATLPNSGNGISINNGASHNRVGGSNSTPGGVCSGECNLISGNGDDGWESGVWIGDSGTVSNTVSGNYIGTDVSGTAVLGNASDGVRLDNGPEHNTIGGATPGERNLISGNGRDGVEVGGVQNNLVTGNYIGTDVSGMFALGNSERGIGMNDGGLGLATTQNTIEGNLISGNGSNGIDVWGPATQYNTVRDNFIGTDVSGTVAVPNSDTGVYVGGGASHNLIGGINTTPGTACSGPCNLISGNGWNGVWINQSDTVSNVVSGNYIGTDATGIGALNTGLGIYLAADHTLVENNIIAYNDAGVALAGAANNTLRANWVGVNAAGAPAGNQFAGVLIGHNTHHNTVGGADLADGNTIAYNGSGGVHVWKHVPEYTPSENYANTISHNSIYSNAGLGIDLVSGANAHMFPPLLTEVSDTEVKGMAVPNATIEIFSDDDDEGRWFHGSTTADADGLFTFIVARPFTGTHVTATATDPDGNTSEFSSPYAPRRDGVVAAIYAPQTRQQIDQPLTSLVRVGNGGTAPETLTVTAFITRVSDGRRVYSDTQTVTDLPALHYRTLAFDAWTPTGLGRYSFAAGLHLTSPDDDPANDRLTVDLDVVDDRVDLWSRDNPADDGREPAVGPVWQSPDIWVRHAADGLTDPQNPVNHITNTVYVRMRNRGTLTATHATVTAYWHPPALVIGQSWWEAIGTATVDELAPGAVYTAAMPWQPHITGVLTEPYHTCLIDVISATQDVAPTWWDVRGSNNIEQRNVDIVAPPETMRLRAGASTTVSTTFSVGNPYAGEQLVDVLLDTSGLPAGTEVRLDLRGLLERWERLGRGSLTGATVVSGTTQVLLSGEQAVISGLPLMGEELFEVAVKVDGLRGRQGQVDVSERIGGEVLGGVSLQVVGRFEVYLPIVIRNGWLCFSK